MFINCIEFLTFNFFKLLNFKVFQIVQCQNNIFTFGILRDVFSVSCYFSETSTFIELKIKR